MFIHKTKASKNATVLSDIPPSRVYNNVCITKFQNATHTVVEQQLNFGLANDLSTDGTKHFKFVTNRFFIHYYGKLFTVITTCTVLIGAHTTIANSTNFSPGA